MLAEAWLRLSDHLPWLSFACRTFVIWGSGPRYKLLPASQASQLPRFQAHCCNLWDFARISWSAQRFSWSCQPQPQLWQLTRSNQSMTTWYVLPMRRICMQRRPTFQLGCRGFWILFLWRLLDQAAQLRFQGRFIAAESSLHTPLCMSINVECNTCSVCYTYFSAWSEHWRVLEAIILEYLLLQSECVF